MQTWLRACVGCFFFLNLLNYQIEVLRVHEGTGLLRLTYVLSMVAGGVGELLSTFLFCCLDRRELLSRSIVIALLAQALLAQALLAGASAILWLIFLYQTSLQRAVCEVFLLHCQSRLLDACTLLALLSTASSAMLYRDIRALHLSSLRATKLGEV
ncbi:MAG: hypothetical protein Q8P67_02155 [archaeon]|nr:hypothetical protein [archaeon]